MYMSCPVKRLKTALQLPEIRLKRITTCYVSFFLPMTVAVCTEYFVDHVALLFIHSAT